MPEPEETAGHSPGHGPPSTRAARCGLRRPYPDTGTKVVPPPGASPQISTASRSLARPPAACMRPGVLSRRHGEQQPGRWSRRVRMPGRDQGLAAVVILPPGQLIGPRAGAHPAGPVGGGQRCRRDRREDGRAPRVRGRGWRHPGLARAGRPGRCPGRSRRLLVAAGRLAPRPAARQPDPDPS
jgi:hypothetical protein